MNTLQQKINEYRLLGDVICQEITQAIQKLGLEELGESGFPVFEQADFRLVVDPYSRCEDLAGYWYGVHKRLIGQIQFHGDGSFYAEYDVLKPHPTKKHYFIDVMNAWGKEGYIKTEPKLLEMPD
jgi:hypothetical protein